MKTTPIRLEIMLSILRKTEENKITTISNIARQMNVSKSTVSRAVQKMEEENLLEKNMLSFTPYGEKVAKKYAKGQHYIGKWIQKYTEIKKGEAEKEAAILMASISEDILDKYLLNVEKYGEEIELEDMESFRDMVIENILPEGSHKVFFTVYKKKNKSNSSNISMGNDGFYHPATLEVNSREGFVVLKSKTIIKDLPGKIGSVKGRVTKLEYFFNGEKIEAKEEENSWYIPLKNIKFSYNLGENIMSALLDIILTCQGSISIMPPSKAVLCLTIPVKG